MNYKKSPIVYIMNRFIREIFPVGQGGFAFESINNYSIVFDCGSSTAPKRVSEYIHQLQIKYTEINQLYLSHFDKDHVNGIKELLEAVRVKEAVVPFIPSEFRTAYNAITRSAYSSIMSLFRENDVNISEVGEENKVNRIDIWEWIAKPMININEWHILMKELELKGLTISQLQDPVYVDSHKKAINDCFKSIFGAYGPNSKGLIMLSQMVNGCVKSNILTYGNQTFPIQKTAALYTGDANLITPRYVNNVKNFLLNYLRRSLALVQIPHHGSKDNASSQFDKYFPSIYYYYQDKSSRRLQQNLKLYNSLTISNNLFEVRDIDSDMIMHEVII